MKYHDFIGKVQQRARLGTTEEAMRATHATLETLGQRLYGGQASNLAAQLPSEIQDYLKEKEESATFGVQEFYQRISKQTNVDLPQVVHHARAVISVVQDAVSDGEIDNVRKQLPEEYDPLFESGSEGEMA